MTVGLLKAVDISFNVIFIYRKIGLTSFGNADNLLWLKSVFVKALAILLMTSPVMEFS